MAERRRVGRTKILKHARILLLDSAKEIDCVICDLTNLGAGLRISPALRAPDTFDLVFDSVLFNRRCNVMWKNGDRLGVSFARV
jgi:hypothetical protein